MQRKTFIGLVVLLHLVAFLPAHGQDDRFQNFIITPDVSTSVNRQLGSVIASDETHLAMRLKNPASEFDGGTIVFMRRVGFGDNWLEIDSVSGPADGGDDIASVLAMDAERLVATGTSFGALPQVSLYRYSAVGDDWTGATTVLPRPASATGQFGSSLAVDGDLIAVGDPGANRVFIYRVLVDSAALIDTVLPVSTTAQSFGGAVGLDAGWLAVGDPQNDVGRVDLYTLDYDGGGAGSSPQLPIQVPADLLPGDAVGDVLAMDDGVIAVGVPRTGFNPGRILIYNRIEITGGDEAYFLFHQADAVDGLARFPSAIDVDSGLVVAGAPGDFLGADSGAAMVFRLSGGTWTNSETFLLSGDDDGFQMGTAVAISGTQALVGVPNRELGGFPPQLIGGIASFGIDCDFDGVSDTREIALGSEVDYDQDGVPDYCELDEFVLVPLDYTTIQSAIEFSAGRVILLEPGTYSEEVLFNGVNIDIRAFDPGDQPIWRTDFAAGTAIEAGSCNLHLEKIRFDGNRTALRAAAANVTAIDCTFTANGHGMDLEDVGLSATDCSFEGNISVASGGSAILADHVTLDLDACSFIDNGGNSADGFHYGGAIRIGAGPGNGLQATACTFDNNAALVQHEQLPIGSQGFASGGAIHADLLDMPSFLYQCSFSDNVAEASLIRTSTGFAASNSARCGAFWAQVDQQDLSISECTFDRNTSSALDTIGGTGFSTTGTLYVEGFLDASAELVNCTVRDSNCTIAYPDGSVVETSRTVVDSVTFYTLDSVSIVGCTFERSGQLYASSIGIVDMFVAVNGSEFIDSGMVLLLEPSNVISSRFVGTLLQLRGDVINSTFEGITDDTLSALSYFGTGASSSIINCDFHRIDAPSVISGGTEAEPLNVTGTTICGNAAQPFLSDLTWNNAGGNTIEGGPNGSTPCPAGATITVPGDQPTIESALLAANNGDTVLIGSGLHLESIDLRGFGEVTVVGSGAGATTIDPPSGEPGVRVHGGTVTLRDLTISGASTGVLADRGTISINDVILENNTGTCGAAIRLGSGSSLEGDGAEAYLVNTILRNNLATGSGGAVCVEDDAALIVESSSFNTNTAGGDGGGVYAEDGARTVTLANTDFDFNIAVDSGGGLHADDVGLLELVEVDLSGNSAGTFGGGARVAVAELTNCDFTGNAAGEVGGGMRSDGTSLLTGCTFQLNIAGIGGGMAATATPSFVDGFSACGNIGGDWYGDLRELEGGALYCSTDCNNNGVPDADELAGGLLEDCNGNDIPDVCEDLADLDGNGIPDACDPTSGSQVLMAILDVVGDLPADAIDVLARPLFRSGTRSHDLLVLDPSGDGAIVPIRPDAEGDYAAAVTLPGAGFERCCSTPFDIEPLCINNGPAGGASLAFARGDVVISHPDGDTGLFDEDLAMYYACNAPAGSGLPSPITDYDLTPETNLAIAVEYVEETEGGLGQARRGPSKRGQVLVAAPTATSGSKPSSSRRGSGQGGTGPYPGVDEENDYGLSIRTLAAGTFDEDENDDLVTLHPDEGSFSIRNFTGIADFEDPLTGELVPSGATWSEPTFIPTTDPGLGMVVGNFVDFEGSADDGLQDVAVVVAAPSGPVLRVWASTAPNTLVRIGSDYPLLSDNFSLGKTRVDAMGNEVVLLAQRDGGGMAYLDYAVFDSSTGDLDYGWSSLGLGEVLDVSTAPLRYGVSEREVVAVLLDLGASTSVTMLELSKRPELPAPANDDCGSAQVITRGSTAFTTLGATTDGEELPVECESDDSRQMYNDVWFSWTASCSGPVTVSTCGLADFDTWIAAYVDGCLGAVTACNDQSDSCPDSTSLMVLEAVAGETYLIRVGSWGLIGEGSGFLSITCPGSPADLNGDGEVDGADLSKLLGGWGLPGVTDINSDGTTDGADLTLLLGEWGI